MEKLLNKIKTLVLQLKPHKFVVITHTSGDQMEIHKHQHLKDTAVFRASEAFTISREYYENKNGNV